MDGFFLTDEMKSKLDIHDSPVRNLAIHTMGGFVLASLGRIHRTSGKFIAANGISMSRMRITRHSSRTQTLNFSCHCTDERHAQSVVCRTRLK